MEFDRLVNLLELKLKSPLPGQSAHLEMAPQPVDMRRFEPKLPEGYRKSGVLLLFYPDQQSTFFPMIKRPDYPGVHGGQVSLPGGKMELSDPDVIYTSLREAEEEIGIDASHVRVLGQMSNLYIPTSNFLVTPVVGLLEAKPKMRPEEKEVQRIITTDLNTVLDLNQRKRKMLELATGIRLDTPYFEIDSEVVWGATAMILSELYWLLRSDRS